jgi:outer membrane biosynthesis protein TonB
MKIKEITNPEEQLGLLRVIIDNTWSAIKQQADTQARHQAAQPTAKPKAKTPKAPKPAPYAAVPKQLPKPKPLYKTNTQTKAQPMATQAHKLSHKQVSSNNGAPNPINNKVLSPADTLKADKEKDDLINLSYGALPRKTL